MNKTRNNYKGNKAKTRSKQAPKTRFKETNKDQYVKESSNDPMWYNSNNQLAFDAGSFSFNTGLGDIDSAYGSNFSVPGVCSIGILPIPIVSNSSNDPVNITSRAFFSNVLRANSRSNPDYEASDLMVYLIAVANAWSALYWCRRLYGMCNAYSQYNRYLPQALVMADGVDFEDLLSNLAKFRYEINAFAVQLATYAVPNNIPYFKRMAWLFNNVYTDDPTRRASIYMYHPEGFGMWSDSGSSGSQIDFGGFQTVHADSTDMYGAYTRVDNSLMTVSEIISMLRQLITKLRDSTDVNNMSGDILKAYGPENILIPDTIDYEYTVYPEYVPEVLTQIHNMTLNGMVVISDEGTLLTQDQNTLNLYTEVGFQPWGAGGIINSEHNYWQYIANKAGAGSNILDLHVDNPTSDDVLVATRLMVTNKAYDYHVSGSTYKAMTVQYGGMDVGTVAYVIDFDPTTKQFRITAPISTFRFCGKNYAAPNDTWAPTSPESSSMLATDFGIANSDFIDVITRYGVFEERPKLVIDSGGDNYDASPELPFSDVDNYVVINRSELSRIHQAAMFSLFNVPKIAIDVK